VRFAEAGLQRVQILFAGVGGQALDGHHRVTAGLHRKHDAGAHRLAVEEDGAGPAHAVFATDVGAGQVSLVADEIGEQQARLDSPLVGLAVDGDGDVH